MNQKQIPDVHALLGGTAAWKSAGYPMEGSGAGAQPPAPGETAPERPPVL